MDAALLRDLLIRWAEINSGSSNWPGLDRMREALAAEFSALPGARVEAVPLAGTPAQALRVSVQPQATKRLLLSGHYDTVYAADHAFQRCTVEGDRLRGPGVADMKGGLVVMLAALREFSSGMHAARLGFDVLLTPDEETGSVASRALIQQEASSQRHALSLVFEPARGNGNLVRARKGIGVFTITCHGRAAHAAGDPAAGRNAILALAEYLPGVDRSIRALKGAMVNVGTIRGGGPVNIVPDFAEAKVNIRIDYLADSAEVMRRLHELAQPINAREGFRLEISGAFERPPKEVSSADERAFALWQSCAAELGVTLSWQDVGGGSDGNLFAAAGLPCLDGLGPVGDHLHSPDEFIRLPTLVERARIAVRFFEKVSTGQFAADSA